MWPERWMMFLTIFGFSLLLGLSVFATGLAVRSNDMRLEVLSKRILMLEQKHGN